jgi:hypothetical protein
MKLSRYLRNKPQRAKNGIGSGPFRLVDDPVLHPGQTFGGLMDIVAVDIGDGLEQLLDALVAGTGRCGYRHRSAASRHQGNRARSVILSHPIAFPCEVPVSAAETSNSAPPNNRPVAG